MTFASPALTAPLTTAAVAVALAIFGTAAIADPEPGTVWPPPVPPSAIEASQKPTAGPLWLPDLPLTDGKGHSLRELRVCTPDDVRRARRQPPKTPDLLVHSGDIVRVRGWLKAKPGVCDDLLTKITNGSVIERSGCGCGFTWRLLPFEGCPYPAYVIRQKGSSSLMSTGRDDCWAEQLDVAIDVVAAGQLEDEGKRIVFADVCLVPAGRRRSIPRLTGAGPQRKQPPSYCPRDPRPKPEPPKPSPPRPKRLRPLTVEERALPPTSDISDSL